MTRSHHLVTTWLKFLIFYYFDEVSNNTSRTISIIFVSHQSNGFWSMFTFRIFGPYTEFILTRLIIMTIITEWISTQQPIVIIPWHRFQIWTWISWAIYSNWSLSRSTNSMASMFIITSPNGISIGIWHAELWKCRFIIITRIITWSS